MYHTIDVLLEKVSGVSTINETNTIKRSGALKSKKILGYFHPKYGFSK